MTVEYREYKAAASTGFGVFAVKKLVTFGSNAAFLAFVTLFFFVDLSVKVHRSYNVT